jgi:hypothetical protein
MQLCAFVGLNYSNWTVTLVMENENINLNRHENLQYLFRCNKGVALGYPFTAFTDHNRHVDIWNLVL